MMSIFYVILAAIALGILVFIHELGHYFMARKTGMIVEVFSIGFGRPLLKWRWQNVDWQLGWLPFGGYVKIAGMEVSKKDKHTYIEPYEVPNGFFSKSPYQRILVALSGPASNLILAFILFSLLWSMGGREKPFSEFTQVIGWVDPHSELYALGVRPGDMITRYDGKPFESSKDLLYAAMLGDRKVQIEGYHINYESQQKAPFSYTIGTYQAPGAIEGILTTGITSTARYLIYDRLPGREDNPLPEGSPMQASGIHYGDRLVWADGELLFSMDQLSHLINQKKALLTVKRGESIFLTRQPRIAAGDLLIPADMRNELMDWQYEAGIHGRWQELLVLPYNLTAEAIVEGQVGFIDEDVKKESIPNYPYSETLEQFLQPGDRILAVDGEPVETAYQLLKNLQTHHVLLIAQRDVPIQTGISWKEEDAHFLKSLDIGSVDSLILNLGTERNVQKSNSYFLLKPVIPKKADQFALSTEAKERMHKEYAERKGEILKMRDLEKRARMLQLIEESQNKVLLGIYLQDQVVRYNPNPLFLFGHAFVETWQTLKALVLGYLNPKWISGPVGIVQVIHHGWQVGIKEALFWIATISLNLGILNLLPLPVLDGGYVCLSLWEMITRRRLRAKTLERIIVPFVVLLIGLLIFLTFQDIFRLF